MYLSTAFQWVLRVLSLLLLLETEPTVSHSFKSYYYFAIIFDLDPIFDSRAIEITHTHTHELECIICIIILIRWHFDEPKQREGQQTRLNRKGKKDDNIWFYFIYDSDLPCIYCYGGIHRQADFTVSLSKWYRCYSMTSWKWWETKIIA